MKRTLSFILVLTLLLSTFAFGEAIDRIEDAVEIESAEVENAVEIESAEVENAADEEIAEAPEEAAETAEANSEEAAAEPVRNAAYAVYGKVQNDAFTESEITGKVTVPAWYTYAIRVEGAAEGQTVAFKSSSAKIATVDTAGLVTFKKAGTVKITCTVTENKKTVYKKTVQLTAVSAPTKVTVTLPAEMPASVAKNGSTIVMQTGASIQLGTELTPSFTTSEITWKSSSKKVLTVSETGAVTAVGKGTAKITATTKNKKSASITVKVVGETDAVAVSLSGDEAIDISESNHKLTCTMTPANAASTIKWSTSSKSVCTVSADGMLTPKKCGTVTITATASSGVKASMKVKITDRTLPSSITLDKTGVVTLGIGDTLQLTATVLPETATGKITWSTSSKSIATVTSEGLVTAKKNGTATITAKTRNGKTTKMKVTVLKAPELCSCISQKISTLTSKYPGTVDAENGTYVSDNGKLSAKYYVSTQQIREITINGGGYTFYYIATGFTESAAVSRAQKYGFKKATIEGLNYDVTMKYSDRYMGLDIENGVVTKIVVGYYNPDFPPIS